MKKLFFLTILSIAIFIPAITHGATEFISTIRSSGGDYSTLSSWESAIQVNLTLNTTRVFSGTGTGKLSSGNIVEWFSSDTYQTATATVIATTSDQILLRLVTDSAFTVSSDDQWRLASSTDNMFTVSGSGSELGDTAIAVAECYNDWASGLADDLIINGWTTGSNNYVKVYAPGGQRHDGWTWTDTNKNVYSGFAMKLSTTWDYVIEVHENYTVIDGLILDANNGTGNNGLLVNNGCDSTKVQHCIGLNVPSGRPFFYLYTAKVSNCIVYDSGIGFEVLDWEWGYLNNNTVVDCGTGFKSGANRGAVCKNCLAHSNTTDFNLSAGTCTNCASFDDTADNKGGTGNRINQSFVFEDEANDDFHIVSGGAVNQGTDLSADGSYPITDDIDYEVRRGLWDIGADQTFRAVQVNVSLKDTGSDSGLVGNWTFNGQDMDWSSSTAEVLDRSGNSNNGNVTNFGNEAVTGGISGQALDFDGVDDYVEIQTDLTSQAQTACTITAWMKFDTVTDDNALIALDADPNEMQIWMDNSTTDHFAITVYDGGWQIRYGDVVPTTDTWYHVAFTHDDAGNGTNKLYVNGVQDGADLAGNWVNDASNNWRIGTNLSGGKEHDGLIDEVRVYNRALSAEEVMDLYQAGARRLQPNAPLTDAQTGGVVGHWTFNGPDMDWSSSTAEVLDRSGNSNNGNVTNFGNEAVTGGISGQALEFDGVDDYVEMADITEIDGAYQLTGCAWVYHDSLTDDDYIMSDFTNAVGVGGFLFFRDDVGGISGRTDTYTIVVEDLDNDVVRIEGATNASKLNTWAHTCFVLNCSGNSLSLYIDAVEDANSPVDASSVCDRVHGNTEEFRIGIKNDLGSHFNGTIDEVRVYNRALSAEEVVDLYRAGAGRFKMK